MSENDVILQRIKPPASQDKLWSIPSKYRLILSDITHKVRAENSGVELKVIGPFQRIFKCMNVVLMIALLYVAAIDEAAVSEGEELTTIQRKQELQKQCLHYLNLFSDVLFNLAVTRYSEYVPAITALMEFLALEPEKYRSYLGFI